MSALALAMCGAAPLVLPPDAWGEPPSMVGYQGRVDVSGAAFSGTGHFRFALVDGTNNQTLWSHDGTSVSGAAPTTPVDLPVVAGLYSVRLGDTNVVGITAPLASDLFAQNSDVRLRVWFDDGTHGLQQLSPDARLSSVGFAFAAEQLTGKIAAKNIPPGIIDSTSLADSAVTSGKIADGAVTAGKLMDASVTAGKILDGSVTGSKIAGGTIEPTHLNPAYGLWKKGPAGLSYDEGGVDIGTGGNRGIAPLHVTSGPAYLNSVFESSSSTGTWLTLGNTSPQGTNWTVVTAGADAAAAGDVGTLVIGPSSGRVNRGAAVLTLAPTSRVGVNTSRPLAPLHVQSPKGDGTLLLLGSAQGETGKSSLALGLTAAAGGTPFVQGVSQGGSSYGTLALNNSGGNVEIAHFGSTLLSPTGGGVGIGLGSAVPAAAMHVNSLGGWVNSIFESSSSYGTWVTIGNTSPRGTNWTVATGGSEAAAAGDVGTLVFAPSARRAEKGASVLTLSPNSRVGVNASRPSAPLQVQASNGDTNILVVGSTPGESGKSSLALGLTAAAGGTPFVQGISQGGSTYGTLALNNSGGNVEIARYGSTLLSPKGGGVGIGLGSALPTAQLQVDSLGGWVNTIFDSSSSMGTWLTIRNSTAGSTNWVIVDTTAAVATDIPNGSLLMATSPSRGAMSANPALVMTPSGNVGVRARNPSAPLHVGAPSTGTAAVRVGGDPKVDGTTLVDIGMSSAKSGMPYIQGVEASGQNYGTLFLNPYGGRVQAGAWRYVNSGSTFSVFQQPYGERCATFHDIDGYAAVTINDGGYAMKVYGEAYKNNGSPFWNTTSDRRLKTDIATLGGALALVDRVRPVTYRYSAEHRAKNPGIPATTQYGVVAQEFAEVFPDFVTSDKDGFLSVNSSPLVFANTAAIRELHAQVATRDARIQALESRNEELQNELSRLKKSCAVVASLSDRLEALEKQMVLVPPVAGGQWAANRRSQ
ncbi:MAG: tail fiber domain-containing protein [Verrucomicrobiales bacterium]|nr:tail fiber domain-containing protein [Verrucomicrobiales bacterium]